MYIHGFAIAEMRRRKSDEPFPSIEELTEVVLDYAAAKFRADRELDQHFLMHATVPHEALIVLSPQTNDASVETLKGSAWIVGGMRKLAKEYGARALFIIAEAWVSNDERYSAANGSEPRLDPKRDERVIVLLENPYARPPMQAWHARIERSKGRPHLAPWSQDVRIANGRLTYLLPRDAYGRVGSS